MIFTIFGDYSTLPAELWEHLKVATWIWDMLRTIGFSLLKALAKLVDYSYDAVTTILKMDLYSLVKNAFPSVFAAIPTIVWSLFSLSVIIAGIKLASSRDKSESSKTIRGMISSALWIVALPTFINSLSALQIAGINDIDKLQVGSGATLGESILSSITIDIDESKSQITYVSDAYSIDINEVLDNEGFWDKKPGKLSDKKVSAADDALILEKFFGADSFYAQEYFLYQTTGHSGIDIDFIEKMIIESAAKRTGNPDVLNCSSVSELFDMYAEGIELFKTTQFYNNSAGTVNSYNTYFLDTEEDYNNLDWDEKITHNMSTFFNPVEYLYAYDFYFINGLLIILTTLISLIFAGLKGGKLLFDLVFNQTIASLVFATDIKEGGRKKYIIQQILSTYLIFIVIMFVIKLYLMVVLFITTSQFNTMVQLMMILAGTAFVIDGPDVVVKLLGIDAGVKSGTHALVGVRTGIGMAKGGVGTAMNAVTAAGNTVSQGFEGAKNIGSSVASAPRTMGKAASSGAKLGSVLGPVGSVIGGAGGLVGGAAASVIKTSAVAAAETAKTAGTAVKGAASVASGKQVSPSSSHKASAPRRNGSSVATAPKQDAAPNSNASENQASAPEQAAAPDTTGNNQASAPESSNATNSPVAEQASEPSTDNSSDTPAPEQATAPEEL